MPYAGDVYSLPPGTSATSNTTILSAMFNAFVADIAAAQNAARPIAVGGTGAATVGAAFDNLHTASSNIASATTTDLSTATGYYVQITGTTTITGFGTEVAGVPRFLRFAGILTLTHNATSLILPSGASITTAAGDTAIVVSEGSGNWRCLAYQKANGESVVGGSPASTTTAGVVELATVTEAATLTDTSRAVTPEGLGFLGGYATTATAAGTTTLTVTSAYNQYFTGTTTQTVVLPVTSTLVLGRAFRIVNNSTGVVTVQSSGANTVYALAPNEAVEVTCILTSGTTAASWATAPFPSGLGYACRAWVNFNGTGTVAIRASGNVSSITDNGTGNYTVNFTTALPDANYAVVGTTIAIDSSNVPGVVSERSGIYGSALRSTTQLAIVTTTGGAGVSDASVVSLVFFR